MAFNIKVDSTGWKNRSKVVSKQIEWAMVTALTDTAKDLVQIERETAKQTIDRPTPFTLGGFRYTKASRNKMESSVYVAPVQSQYLEYQVFGGSSSKHKPVPSRMMENQYGNLPRGAYQKGRTYNVSANGKHYTFIRTGAKGKSRLMATWRDKRQYKKIFPFHERARTRVPIYFRRVFGQHLRNAFATARG
jgi:hypothetical protein